MTGVDSPASQTVCHTESSVEASATVCQIELPRPDWTDAQPRDWGVEMTEPELQQGTMSSSQIYRSWTWNWNVNLAQSVLQNVF